MLSVMQSTFAFIGVAFAAILWKLTLHDTIFVTLGVWRELQPLSDFPYTCRKVKHPVLEGCEDMWLDDDKRILYAACARTADRLHWNPGSGVLNASGRTDTSTITMLDIDMPGTNGQFNARAMKTVGYVGALGGSDKTLDLHGFDVEILGNNKLRFWLINHRPPVNSEGHFLDASRIGQNSTIEIFEAQRGGNRELRHVRTIKDPAVFNPNKVAADGKGGFVSTNDKSGPPGFRRELDNIVGGGSVASCTGATDAAAPPSCRIAASGSFSMPNGMVRGADGLFYVPASAGDDIKAMRLRSDRTLELVTIVRGAGMPMDNFAVDGVGDIWAAAFPKVLAMVASMHDRTVAAPSTVFRIRRKGGWKTHTSSGQEPEFEVQKMLEDATGTLLSGMTVARHDVKTGRLFLGGVLTEYIVVCEPNRALI